MEHLLHWYRTAYLHRLCCNYSGARPDGQARTYLSAKACNGLGGKQQPAVRLSNLDVALGVFNFKLLLLFQLQL